VLEACVPFHHIQATLFISGSLKIHTPLLAELRAFPILKGDMG